MVIMKVQVIMVGLFILKLVRHIIQTILYQYLSGDQFPIDKEIWLTKEDVANGYDTVVEEAVSWINNLSHCLQCYH